MKGCCAEVISKPKLSVDQNKLQGIQKVNLKHFKLNHLFGSLQICSAITIRPIKTLKVDAAEKKFKFRLSTLPQMASTKVFYIKMSSDFI